MAQAAGFTCDVCGTFEAAVKNSSSVQPPTAWLRVQANTEHGEREGLDVCSNACLAVLGKLRWECEPAHEGKRFTFNFIGGAARKRTLSPDELQIRRSSLVKARAAKAAKREGLSE